MPPRALAIKLAVERTLMFRGGAGAMTVSPSHKRDAQRQPEQVRWSERQRCPSSPPRPTHRYQTMTDYRRLYNPGATYFFPLVTEGRRPLPASDV